MRIQFREKKWSEMHVVNWNKIEKVAEISIYEVHSINSKPVLLKTELKKVSTNSAKYPNAPYVQVDHLKKLWKKYSFT